MERFAISTRNLFTAKYGNPVARQWPMLYTCNMQVKNRTPAAAVRLADLVSDLVRQLRLLDRDQTVCHGVTLPQCYALDAIGESGPLRMQELAARLGVVQSTITRILAPLERRGLIRRQPDPDDGRAVQVRLTRAGRSLCTKLRSCSLTFFTQVLDGIPRGDRQEVVRGLTCLTAAVRQQRSCCSSP